MNTDGTWAAFEEFYYSENTPSDWYQNSPYETALMAYQAATAAADEKYLGVIRELATAVKAADAVGSYRGHMGEMAQATMSKALALAAPLLGEK